MRNNKNVDAAGEIRRVFTPATDVIREDIRSGPVKNEFQISLIFFLKT